MKAILSDVHGNLEALEAVLVDAKHNGADEFVCLGDLVGYGPDPIPCIEEVMSWQIVLMGNHDHAAISDDDLSGWTAGAARRTILNFRRSLINEGKQEVGQFLASRPTSHVSEAFYVHGTPHDHLHEYLFPEDIYNQKKMDAVSKCFDAVCFCGHTHIPGIFVQRKPDTWDYFSSAETQDRVILGNQRIICNVGSVGQPRDDEPRASYVLFDGSEIRFRRVEYDVERTIAKIRADDDFDDLLGDRLGEGR